MPARKYTEQQQVAFMAVIDRGGSVRSAAAKVGVHPDAGYKWMKQAGLSTSRSAQRRFTAEEKSAFLRRLVEVGNVSRVARELGINRVTGYAWAHRAGIFTSDAVDVKRREFFRLRGEGVSRRDAAKRLGIESHQASDWDKGIRVFSKGRVLADGRVVLYRQDEILANVRRPRTAWIQGERVALDKVEKIIHSRYLSVLEREQIKDLQLAGLSIRQIAIELGRAPSTISRELQRNTVGRRGYLPHTAHRTSVKRRERPREARLKAPGPLRNYVQAKLAKRWSPEQISNRLRRDFPHDPEMRVSVETIYQAIYIHARGELTNELNGLRRGRRRRKPRKDPSNRTSRFTDTMTPLSERPAEVEDRTIPGHWEGDLIVGTGNGSARRRGQGQHHRCPRRSAHAVATLSDLGSGVRDECTPELHPGNEHGRLFLRACIALATRHEREHKRTAAPIPAQAQRPSHLLPRRPHHDRCRTQRPATENPQLGHTRRAT
ncbi:hypothetical protein GCM10009655_15340 [Rhodoglobus aureus]|uniref:Transposase IS30-like HTH domain-containing protein n=1 Tax=Rhodoglobus aureus TaxID=191497 RepID=A0ABN1VMA6_9MICO